MAFLTILKKVRYPGSSIVLAILILCSGLCISCSETEAQGEPELVWPLPPQKPRIMYLGSISSSQDIGVKYSVFRRVFDFVLGRQTRHQAMVRPIGTTVDNNHRIFVTDPGAACVHIFDSAKHTYRRLTGAGKGNLLQSPVDIKITPEGNVFVTDSERGEVIAYDQKGDYLFTIQGYFKRPTGLCLRGEQLYVVDTALNRIFCFDFNGIYQGEYGSRGTNPGEFNFPVFITATEDFIVADAMNFRIQILDEDMESKFVFGEMGDVQGTFSRPKGVGVDSEGHIYVVDGLFNAFQIFDQEGNLLLVVGSAGYLPGQFNLPAGLFIDDEDKIYVVDTMNRRVQIFQYLAES
jgi:sugar lactone lactonase YvrE